MISAVLLAAGMSVRMGRANKLLLPVQGEPMVRRVASAIVASAAAEMVVVLGHEAPAVREALAGLPLLFVITPDYATGMTGSIQRGLAAWSPAASGFMICLADLPDLFAEEYDQLIHAFLARLALDPACIVVPEFEGRRGNPVLFSAQHRAAILAHSEPEGCRSLVQAQRAHLFPLQMNTPHCLHDIDTPEAYGEIPL